MSSKERFPLESTEMSDPCITRVLVLGGTGHGKSSFINAMIGEDKCTVGVTWAADKSITTDVEEFSITRGDGTITFFDTPALKTLSDNNKFRQLYKNGFNAVVIVYSIKPFTQTRPSLLQQVENVLALKDYTGSNLLVALTFADFLEDATVEEFLNTNKELKDFQQKYGVNLVAICNTFEKYSQEGIGQRNTFFNSLDAILRQNDQPISKKPCVVGIKCKIGIIVTSIIVIGIGIFLYFHVF